LADHVGLARVFGVSMLAALGAAAIAAVLLSKSRASLKSGAFALP
jgi:hypothetical protein